MATYIVSISPAPGNITCSFPFTWTDRLAEASFVRLCCLLESSLLFSMCSLYFWHCFLWRLMCSEAYFLDMHSRANRTLRPFLSIKHHGYRLNFHWKVQKRQILRGTIYPSDCIGSAFAFVELHPRRALNFKSQCASKWMPFVSLISLRRTKLLN